MLVQVARPTAKSTGKAVYLRHQPQPLAARAIRKFALVWWRQRLNHVLVTALPNAGEQSEGRGLGASRVNFSDKNDRSSLIHVF
jgi:hypothetical protein